MKAQVVMFKHHSPYNGCFWQWQHVVILDDEVHPVTWATDKDYHMLPESLDDLKNAGYVSDITVDNWQEEYQYHENYTPAFFEFAEEHELSFKWECQGCGLTHERPLDHGGNYGGNGGIGITVYGWYCEDCYSRLTCSYCGELNDPENAWWDYNDDLVKKYNEGVCPSCGQEM